MHRKFQQRRDSALSSGGRTAAQHILHRANRQIVALLKRKHGAVLTPNRRLDVFLMQSGSALRPTYGPHGPIWGR